ncbi:hypothetical protein BDV28DRAFT_144502 [Aspergillus coremiiformis]|uniref:C2H2-type domain-containing protein n=1 Tax=Aspergillus coremiiformis TaxID=138285 RepID=A0A5N6YR52_9EURO|nr:hypothetical protein BDV28DRAFT_144502 [Aspergillus coremiiformis]
MSMYPSIRNKGFISEPTSIPFINFQDPVCIQDDQFLPDLSQEAALQFHNQQLPRLQSPFQYQPGPEFYSPPSSVPSSPTSSPASPVSYLPATTTVAAEYPSTVFGGNSFDAPSMTPASSYDPSFNIRHTATPPSSQPYYSQYPQQYLFDNSPMLAQQPVANNHSWESNLQLLGPARIQHKASPSVSSSRSAPAGSCYQRSKPLPAPVQTPIQNSFLTAPYQQNYDTSVHDGNQAEAEMVRRAVMEQQQKQQQKPQNHHQHQPSDYSMAPSVSTVSHNSPVTPHTNFEELDDASRAMVNGEKRYPDIDRWMDEYLHVDALIDYGSHNGNNLPIGIPKINRTMSDIYQDELYNPSLIPTPQVSKPSSNQQNLLNPFRNVFADRLQAANQGHMSARSQSPVVGMNRDRSPFRQNSPLAAEYNSVLQQPQMATSVPMSQNVSQAQGEGEPKTMSPKDALLDFNEGDDAGIPLFPTNQPDFNLSNELGLRRESSSSFPQSQNFSSVESFPAQYAPPSGLPQQYPFAQEQQDRQPQPQNNLLHQTPEFPASLPHFESTSSDVGVNNGAGSPRVQPTMAMRPVKEEITRPQRTTADGGTYTCTYHGCTLRFETPMKLQKHKREAHRQTTPGGHLVGRDTSARNSQAGPHKCERINPSTGKPCNSVFSRPYDLTRHEDTIHNARKQKVRCHLCTEEKTFSRNDALTRHMRVVHPEVDWPGKQKRKGRE